MPTLLAQTADCLIDKNANVLNSVFLGGLVAGGHANDTDHTESRDYEKPSNWNYPQRAQNVVLARQRGESN